MPWLQCNGRLSSQAKQKFLKSCLLRILIYDKTAFFGANMMFVGVRVPDTCLGYDALAGHFLL